MEIETTLLNYFPITELPIELVYHVFYFLDVEALGKIAQVNHSIRKIAEDDGNSNKLVYYSEIWRKFISRWNLEKLHKYFPKYFDDCHSLKLIYKVASNISNPHKKESEEDVVSYFNQLEDSKWINTKLSSPDLELDKMQGFSAILPNENGRDTIFAIMIKMNMPFNAEEVLNQLTHFAEFTLWDPAIGYSDIVKYLEEDLDIIEVGYPPGPYALRRRIIRNPKKGIYAVINCTAEDEDRENRLSPMSFVHEKWTLMPTGWFLEVVDDKNCKLTYVLKLDTHALVRPHMVWRFTTMRATVCSNLKQLLAKKKLYPKNYEEHLQFDMY